MVGNLKLESPSSSLLSRHVAVWGWICSPKDTVPKYGGQGGGDVLCSGVWISYQKEGCCWTVRRCLQANAILSESVSLRTPGGERVRLQIINSVTVKQKSCWIGFTVAQGFGFCFCSTNQPKFILAYLQIRHT